MVVPDQSSVAGTLHSTRQRGKIIASNTCIVIVDPYSSGAMLAEALLARIATCVAVQSSLCLPQTMKSRFDPGAYLDIIQHDSDLDKTLDAVRLHQPTHVIAGFESG